MTLQNIHLVPAYAMPLMVAQVSERTKGRLKVAPYFALNFSEPNLTVGQTVANELQTVNEFIETNQTELLKDGRNIARSFYNRTFVLRTGEFSFDQYGTTAGSDGIVGQYDEAGNLTVSDPCIFFSSVVAYRISSFSQASWFFRLWFELLYH